jgi:hypothetical protein
MPNSNFRCGITAVVKVMLRDGSFHEVHKYKAFVNDISRM